MCEKHILLIQLACMKNGSTLYADQIFNDKDEDKMAVVLDFTVKFRTFRS